MGQSVWRQCQTQDHGVSRRHSSPSSGSLGTSALLRVPGLYFWHDSISVDLTAFSYILFHRLSCKVSELSLILSGRKEEAWRLLVAYRSGKQARERGHPRPRGCRWSLEAEICIPVYIFALKGRALDSLRPKHLNFYVDMCFAFSE